MMNNTIVESRPVAKEQRTISKKWLDNEGSAYAFLSMYALLFIIFIVVPVIVAIFLSFTVFDSIQ